MSAKCFRSMKKNESPHSLEVTVSMDKAVSGARCSCVAGASGYCHHKIGLLFYVAHCKQLGLKALPDELTCTSMPQRWHLIRTKTIEQKEVQDLLVKMPQSGADYTKYIKSTLYSPAKMYSMLTKSQFSGLEPKPLMATLAPKEERMAGISFSASRFGNVPKGSVLSYQQKLSQVYVINDYS